MRIKHEFGLFLRKRFVFITIFFVLGALVHTGVHAFTFTLDVEGPDGQTIGPYRWLIEEDLTFHNDPSQPVPEINPDALGLNFHRSYMPVVARSDGFVSGAVNITVPDGSRYFVSVLPQTNFAMGGAAVSGPGLTSVVVNELPVPTAQISIFVFHDNSPINNAPDLPQEQGLPGFQIIIEEAGGRFGASGGQVLQDAFGNPLGTRYTVDGSGNPVVVELGDGTVFTDADGVAVVKYLPPAKYGVRIDPPEGQGWVQTSTIEGTKTIDAWVKPNEPPYFTEFGPAGHHVEFGFIKPFSDPSAIGMGSTNITGTIRSVHNSRPPDYTFHAGAVFPEAWVGLNNMAVGKGQGVYAAPADPDTGTFSINGVAPGNYQLAIWDTNLDIIFASLGITVNADGTCGPDHGPCALGDISVFDWFGHLQGRVFYDRNKNGFDDGCLEPGCSGPEDEPGMEGQAVNIRWRDGTLFQTTATNSAGDYSFNEVFPFFDWLVAEVDFARYKATGMTAVADNGGLVLPHAGWDWPSFGRLTPQEQFEDNTVTGNNLSRTETGEILSQGFQLFLGQTNVVDWGKIAYQGQENGGISGMVFYDTTRAENDPRYNFGETWQPGIPRVQVNLYQDLNGDGIIDDQPGTLAGIQLADVDNFPFGWSEGGSKGPEDVDYNGNGIFEPGDAIDITWTDSWDDDPPENCPGGGAGGGPTPDINGVPDPFFDADNDGLGDCYDGLRNFNQVRDAVFDGGFAFPGYNANTGEGLLPGIYIVEVSPPRGPDGSETYKVVRSQDRNVDFGEEYTPSPLALPAVCVGEEYIVPPELSLLPGEPAPLAGQAIRHCDLKQVELVGGQNAPVEFFLFTDTPISAHVKGFILDDLANEFDPQNPNFGEKFALPFVPVSFRDWTGREITRIYSDQYGNYNALVPSTFTTNLASPSGMGPNMLIACMNDPGPIPDPNDPGKFITDPNFKPQYTQFCYTFQYMPGATTYLDTPVEPIAAFAGQNQAPLDCEFPDRTPVIASVSVPSNGFGGGPYAPSTGMQIVITAVGNKLVTDPAGTGQIERDYGFGDFVPGSSKVMLGGVELADVSWSSGSISATIPAGADTGRLTVVRGDSGLSSVMGVTVTIGPIAGTVRQVGLGQSIQDVIDVAQNGDLILVPPKSYNESVIMWKDIQLQGWGAPSTIINAVKAPGEKIQLWREDALFLVNNNLVDILPGQEVGFDPANNEPDFLTTSEAPGIIVFAKQTDPLPSFDPRIDGFTITGSDIGGGIVVNAYVSDLTISNNRIRNNAGIYGGGITVGHLLTADGPEDAHNDNIKILHNHITQNGSRTGGSGGVALFTGADNYEVGHNYICGNFTKGSGAGIGHNGLCNNGLIYRNQILFNQAFDQLPATGSSGGGIAATGIDFQGNRSGTGNITINANMIQGNLAGAGDGGGIRLAATDAITGAARTAYTVNVVNNMIVNNVSGFAGGGIALQDAPSVNIVHNTVANNDSTATAGEAFTADPNVSAQQPAGIASRAHSPILAGIVGAGFSNPLLSNNIIYHNRSFYWDSAANNSLGGLLPDVATPDYRDLGVIGAAGQLDPQNCILASLTGFDGADYSGNGNITGDPQFIEDYFNGDSTLTAIPEDTTPLNTAAAVDEGGNFIDVRFGPLQPLGDYHVFTSSPAADAGAAIVLDSLLETDFDGDSRPAMAPPDIGADEATQAAPDFCEGDLNGDHVVDVADLSIFGASFPAGAGDPNYDPSADLNGDGSVDVADLSIFAADFGRTDCP